jgi:hypothetical protein
LRKAIDFQREYGPIDAANWGNALPYRRMDNGFIPEETEIEPARQV